MREARPSPFKVLSQGFLFLYARPLWTLGLAALAMALSALGAYLQLRVPTGGSLPKEMILASTAVLPMEMYFVPRFLAAVDAETLDRPENPAGEWRRRFDGRWLRSFGAKLLLAVAVSLGIMLLVVPGLVVLLLFGWAPTLVLLRGQDISLAARSSARWMARLWPRALLAGCAILTLYLGAALGVSALHAVCVPDPTPVARLCHPGAWAAQFLMGLVNLWLSAAFLALFHTLEREAELTSGSKP